MKRRLGMPSSHGQGQLYTSDSCKLSRCQPSILCLVHKLMEWSMLTSKDEERVGILGTMLQCLPCFLWCAFLLCFRDWHLAPASSWSLALGFACGRTPAEFLPALSLAHSNFVSAVSLEHLSPPRSSSLAVPFVLSLSIDMLTTEIVGNIFNFHLVHWCVLAPSISIHAQPRADAQFFLTVRMNKARDCPSSRCAN